MRSGGSSSWHTRCSEEPAKSEVSWLYDINWREEKPRISQRSPFAPTHKESTATFNVSVLALYAFSHVPPTRHRRGIHPQCPKPVSGSAPSQQSQRSLGLITGSRVRVIEVHTRRARQGGGPRGFSVGVPAAGAPG